MVGSQSSAARGVVGHEGCFRGPNCPPAFSSGRILDTRPSLLERGGGWPDQQPGVCARACVRAGGQACGSACGSACPCVRGFFLRSEPPPPRGVRPDTPGAEKEAVCVSACARAHPRVFAFCVFFPRRPNGPARNCSRDPRTPGDPRGRHARHRPRRVRCRGLSRGVGRRGHRPSRVPQWPLFWVCMQTEIKTHKGPSPRDPSWEW